MQTETASTQPFKRRIKAKGAKMKKTLLVTVSLLLVSTAVGRTRLVPSEYATIQDAIDECVNGDVVLVATGTYTGPGNRDIDFLGKAITVRSLDPCDPSVVVATVIDCQASPSDLHRGFKFHRGEGPNSVLSGLTIKNGYGPKEEVYKGQFLSYGGAIFCKNSSPTIRYCLITKNSSISHNSNGGGGGIYCRNSKSTISSCTFKNNSAEYGAGIYCSIGNPTISNCKFINNSGGVGAGVLCQLKSSNPTITHCIFRENSASRSGGGLRCTGASPKIINCIFTKNSSGRFGGAISCNNSTATIVNCTITKNTNGGFYCDYKKPTLTNCIVWDNSGPEINGSATVTYSDVQGGYAGEGNINANPKLASDGYHLLNGSPCIDTGDPNYTPEEDVTDIDGDPRVLWNRIDIGADEYCVDTLPLIKVWPSHFQFQAVAGADNPEPKILYVRNNRGGTLNWHITEDCDWLDVWPTSGTSTGDTNEVIISIDSSDLPQGDYSCVLTISDPNAMNTPKYIYVDLYVGTPIIGIEPNEFSFFSPVGGPNPQPQILSIWNDDIGTLNWYVIDDCEWLNVWPNSGQSTGEVNEVIISVDSAGLEYGKYTSTMIITDSNFPHIAKTINVTLYCGVTFNVPDEYPTIQAAINAAPDGGTVIVAPGTYTGYGNRDLDFHGKAITVRSADPNNPNIVAATIIDCNGTGQDEHRGFYFHNGEDGNSILEGITITNGNADEGGAIFCDSSGPTISKCKITGNSAEMGAGIFGYHSNPNITNCTISGNSIWGEGGGIWCYESNLDITNCTITDNNSMEWGGAGGGIYCMKSNVTITNCTISGNAIWEYGGGIFCSDSNATITGCTISDNISDEYGGGIYCRGSITIADCNITGNSAGEGGGIYCGRKSSPTIINCTIAENKGCGILCAWESSPIIKNCIISGNYDGVEGGGGISCFYESNPTITNCIISGNFSGPRGSGGGISIFYGLCLINNCIIAGNSAESRGGGINFRRGELTLNNSTICGNKSNSGGAIYCHGDTDLFITNCILWDNEARSPYPDDGPQICLNYSRNNAFVSYSNVQGGKDDVYIHPDSTLSWAEGNMNADPCFVVPGYWDPNGTWEDTTDDFWVDGDYHLLEDSLCINAGNPFFEAGPNSVDIDGEPRIMGCRLDMGADEVVLPATTTLTKPTGGEVWSSGSTKTIEWTSCDVLGTVDIYFSDNNGVEWMLVEEGAANTGSYALELPLKVYSEQCQILVVPSIADANAICIESGVFTVKKYPKRKPAPTGQARKGVRRDTGLSENYGPEFGCVKWQFETNLPVFAGVTISDDDRILITCQDGSIYKIDPNGELLWSYKISEPITWRTPGPSRDKPIWHYEPNLPPLSSPAVGYYGMVYVGGEDGKLYAINGEGELLWTHTTDGPIYSSPVVSPDGKIYACSLDGGLYALGHDGSELWSFETGGFGAVGGSIFGRPAIGFNGTIYIAGLYDPNLYALDPNDGSVKWACSFIDPCDANSSAGWPFVSPVVAEDGTIYQTLLYNPRRLINEEYNPYPPGLLYEGFWYDSRLYAIDPNNGNILWSTNMTDTAAGWFEPHYAEGRYGASPYPYEWVDGSGWPFGRGPWTMRYYLVGNSSWTEPALGPDGTIYVSFDDPYLRAVDPNGSIKWVTRLGMMGGFTLTVGSDGLIYAASDDSHLYVVSPDGEEIARFEGSNWLSFPVIAADNTIIINDSNNIVWAIGGDGCEEQQAALHRPEDLNTDWAVDLRDFALIAANWLGCTDKPDSGQLARLHRQRTLSPGICSL
jgi:parallel beta-helix repeat protein/predicted outer membrane repeat protein